MKKKPKNKEKIFWILFPIAILVVMEITTYTSTGHFLVCNRYGNCSEVDFWTLLMVIIFMAITSVVINYFNHNNLFKDRRGISPKAASWYQFIFNLLLMLSIAVVLIFVLNIIER